MSQDPIYRHFGQTSPGMEWTWTPLNLAHEDPEGGRIPYASQDGVNGLSFADLEFEPLESRFYSSFSGADISATILVPGYTDPVIFGELRAIAYSTVRDKRPLRILGSMNPACWSRSTRLVAGSLVFTSFDRYIWLRLTGAQTSSKGIITGDMLPPFDVIITALNEYGQTSRLVVRGVRIVDEGSVIGVDDLYIEQTHTYVAQDVVPWVPYQDGGEPGGDYPITSEMG